MDLRGKVSAYIRQHNMIAQGDYVLAGVSGGADSVCLLLVLKDLQQDLKFKLDIVNVEHGIRGDESLQDTEFVKNLAGELGIDCHCISVDVPALSKEMKRSVEETARIARYNAFYGVAAETGATKIAVAHNENDNAETLLLNLIRGTSIAGLTGIRPVRDNIIRPLLCVGRAEIEEYLGSRNISYRNDSTNESAEYARNKIRPQIMPLLTEINPGAVHHMAVLSGDMEEIYGVVDACTKLVSDKVTTKNSDGVTIDREALAGEKEIIQRFVLRKEIIQAAGAARDIGRTHIEDTFDLMKGETGKKIDLPYGLVAETSYEKLVISKGVKSEAPIDAEYKVAVPGRTGWDGRTLTTTVLTDNNWSIEKKPYTKCIDYDRIESGLVIRHRTYGDVICTRADGGRAKIKDFFINEKIPADERDRLWMICDGSQVVWIPGYRLSEAYKVTDGTKRVLELELTEDNNG